jgi:hypothetical protein
MKMPAAWAPAPTKTDVRGSTQVTARIDMSAEVAGAGLCPDCHKPMEAITAGPVDTMTCMNCRISIPTADEPVVEATAGPSTYLDQ